MLKRKKSENDRSEIIYEYLNENEEFSNILVAYIYINSLKIEVSEKMINVKSPFIAISSIMYKVEKIIYKFFEKNDINFDVLDFKNIETYQKDSTLATYIIRISENSLYKEPFCLIISAIKNYINSYLKILKYHDNMIGIYLNIDDEVIFEFFVNEDYIDTYSDYFDTKEDFKQKLKEEKQQNFKMMDEDFSNMNL